MGDGAESFLDAIYQDIKSAVGRTLDADRRAGGGKRTGDRYVTGGTNWDGYDLNTLIGMVAQPASPAQVDAVAGLWRTHGASITQSAENLAQSLHTLMNYWQGSAAEQATNTVTGNANWIGTVGQTAGQVADSVEDAGGALRSAQNTMPGAPASAPWSGFGTAAGGAAAGAVLAGPFGAAAGAMVGGLASVFGSGDNQNQLKQQAVQTMQRYEQAAVTIDTNTPRFAVPAGAGTDSGAATASDPGGGTTSGTGTPPTDPAGALSTALDQNTLPSFAADPTARWHALTGGAGGLGGRFGGAGSGGLAGARLGLVNGAKDSGGEPETARSGAAATGVAGALPPEGAAAARGAAPGVLEDVDRPAAAGGGFGGAGARSAGNGTDREHKRRIPFEDEPFVTGLKAVPAVIGLSALQREAGR